MAALGADGFGDYPEQQQARQGAIGQAIGLFGGYINTRLQNQAYKAEKDIDILQIQQQALCQKEKLSRPTQIRPADWKCR